MLLGHVIIRVPKFIQIIVDKNYQEELINKT
jgi:hypothetical protein